VSRDPAADPHFLHAARSLEALVSPRVDHPRALCWLDADALIVAGRDGTLAFTGGRDGTALQGSGTRELVLRPGTPKERRIGGQAYLLAYGLPQFFFHVTTAYDLLRHNGVGIGKKDYMGAY